LSLSICACLTPSRPLFLKLLASSSSSSVTLSLCLLYFPLSLVVLSASSRAHSLSFSRIHRERECLLYSSSNKLSLSLLINQPISASPHPLKHSNCTQCCTQALKLLST
jgi:hypothetical protein